MDDKRIYEAPALSSVVLRLGIFGDYGQGGDPGTDTPHPRIPDFFELDRP